LNNYFMGVSYYLRWRIWWTRSKRVSWSWLLVR